MDSEAEAAPELIVDCRDGLVPRLSDEDDWIALLWELEGGLIELNPDSTVFWHPYVGTTKVDNATGLDWSPDAVTAADVRRHIRELTVERRTVEP